MRHRVSLAAVLIASAIAARANADTYTITGTIRTSADGNNVWASGAIVKYITVQIMDVTPGSPDRLEASGVTDENGNFSIGFNDPAEAPDIYVNVKYVGTALDGHFIEVRQDNQDPTPILDTNIEFTVHENIQPGTLALGDLYLFGTRANIVTQAGDALRYLRTQYPGFAQTDDLRAEGTLSENKTFFDGLGGFISIGMEDYDHPGAPAAAFSNIHHEVFHWVAWRAYGNRSPVVPQGCDPGQHVANRPTCEGFALKEGMADYFQSISFPASFSGRNDSASEIPPVEVWRGAPDGTGIDNAGDIVEGALQRVWFELNDPPAVLGILLSSRPSTIEDFKTAWIALKGSPSAGTRKFYDVAAENGIVYTRGSFGETPFQEEPPAPSTNAPGNYRLIDGIVFLRGKVTPHINVLSHDDLKLGPTSRVVDATYKTIGYKPAVSGDGENFPLSPSTSFTFLPVVAVGEHLMWDTSAVADADYDLIVRTANVNGWADSFLPSFAGDLSDQNTDEKRLKDIGTWFEQTNALVGDDTGKVIVDNTGPTVTNMKP